MSFRFTKLCRAGDPAKRENIGAVFDEYVKLLLVRLRPGDVLIFTNIKGVRPDGSPVTFNDITLRLN